MVSFDLTIKIKYKYTANKHNKTQFRHDNIIKNTTLPKLKKMELSNYLTFSNYLPFVQILRHDPKTQDMFINK